MGAKTEPPTFRLNLNLSMAAAMAALILAPFLWPKISEMLTGAGYYKKPGVKKGIDALFLFVPVAQHPVWGGVVAPLYDELRRYASVGFVCSSCS